MGLAPGDILRVTRIVRSIRGDYHVYGQDGEGNFAEGKLASSYMSGRFPGDAPRELVCLPGKAPSPIFAEANFEHKLIEHFYLKGARAHLEAQHPDLWINRWKDAAQNAPLINCNLFERDDGIPKLPNRLWWFIRSKRWIMPVANSTYFNPDGRLKFCPSSLHRGMLHHILPTCYETQSHGGAHHPPFGYNAQVVFPGVPTRLVNIHLHGFLYPPKAHYGVRKHLLSHTPSSRKSNERAWWQHWLDRTLPPPSEVDEIFHNCLENQKETGCVQCSLDQFFRVDQAIQPLLRLYRSSLVDFFESSTVKHIFLSQSTLQDLTEIEIVSIGEETINMEGIRVKFHPALLLWGWTYNWEDSDQTAVIHLGVVTFFLRVGSGLPKGRMHHVWRKGRLVDVRRI